MTTPGTSPRILAIMGSGETAPTMNAPHRAIFERLGPDVDAVLLDTPFGFQENAPILASKAIEYFRDAVSRRVEAAGLTRTDTGDTVAVEVIAELPMSRPENAMTSPARLLVTQPCT